MYDKISDLYGQIFLFSFETLRRSESDLVMKNIISAGEIFDNNPFIKHRIMGINGTTSQSEKSAAFIK